MEWVETTGRNVDEAKEAALDELGVDAADAEFEIVEEPRPGLFGRMRGEARVRARVAPTQPRPKVERRERRRRSDSRSSRGGKGAGGSGRGGNGRSQAETTVAAGGQGEGGGESAAVAVATAVDQAEPAVAAPPPPETDRTTKRPGGPMTTDLEPAEQATTVADFLDGLLEAFGLDGEVTTELVDDDAVEAKVTGDDLGLLIGPKGTTLNAVQELSRTVVQRQATNPTRVRVDVGGYRERRRAALARFTEQVAAEVIETGAQKALEPMSPPDRKVVHDTVNEIEGVSTVSEGEEPRRRVVIVPAS